MWDTGVFVSVSWSSLNVWICLQIELWIQTVSASSLFSPKRISCVSVCVCMLFIHLFIYLPFWCDALDTCSHFNNTSLHFSSMSSFPHFSQLLPAPQQSESQWAVSSSLFILTSSFRSLLLLLNSMHGKCETDGPLKSIHTQWCHWWTSQLVIKSACFHPR